MNSFEQYEVEISLQSIEKLLENAKRKREIIDAIKWEKRIGDELNFDAVIVGEYNGISFSHTYDRYSWFNYSLKRAKRKISKAVLLLDKHDVNWEIKNKK